MRYTVTTFKVGLEVAEAAVPTRTAEDVWRFSDSIFRDLDADKEHFVLLALSNKNRVNGFKVISTGTLTTSLVRPGDVYRAALHLAAAAVVFVHNHPSGDPAVCQYQFGVCCGRRDRSHDGLKLDGQCGTPVKWVRSFHASKGLPVVKSRKESSGYHFVLDTAFALML